MSITANGAAPVTITVDTTDLGLDASRCGTDQGQVSSVVFIDARVPDVDQLIGGTHAGQRVLLLDPHADGVRQISDTLAAHGLRDLSAIHIVSHGTPGQIQIGATLLNARALADHAALLADIGAALASGGGILLYGCDVASGAAGRHFIEELSVYTSAEVAAASHPVGAAARGGSWELDVSTGPIAAVVPFGAEVIAGYRGVLVNAPEGTDNTISTNEDTARILTAADFGFTDPDDAPDNNFTAVTITTLPTAGSLTLNSVAVIAGQSVSITDINNNLLVFTPAGNANGAGYATFTFQVQDDGGGTNLDQTANTMTIDVTSVNDAPAGTNNTISTNEDTARILTAADFGFTDPDDAPDNNFTAVTITTLPTAGSLTLNSVAVIAGQSVSITDINNNLLVFTPAGNANGAGYATFTFQVQDDGGGTNLDQTANTMTIDVTSVNDAPAGTNNTISTNEDTARILTAADFGFTDPDDAPDNNFTAVTITTLPTAGSLTLNSVAVIAGQSVSITDINNNLLVFTPAGNANGAGYATFTFQVQDDGGGTNLDQTANTMTIDVTSVNDAPAGTNNTISTNEDTARILTAADFGFTDPDDAPDNNFTAVTITTLPTAGSLTLNSVAVIAGQSVSITDINNNLLVFTPAGNANGAGYATFTFQVQDDGGGTNLDQTANTMTIDVTSVNDAPAGTNNTISTNEDTARILTAADFGFTDPDDAPDNNFTAVTITTLPTAGSLTLNSVAVIAGQSVSITDINNNLLVFTPAGNANGAGYATFTFQVQDDGGGTNLDQTANTMTIDVTSVNDAPAGTNNTISTNEDTARILTAADFGFTDPDDAPDNNFTAVTITTLPTAGSLTLNSVAVIAGQSVSITDINNNLLVFTPAGNANGAGYATFTFQVQDDGGGTNLDQTANTMTIDVTSVNDAPVLNATKTPVLAAENEDSGAPVGAVGTLISALIDMPGSGSSLDNVTDVDTGALTGLALTGATGSGTWWYSTNNGGLWQNVGAVTDISARLLAADAGTRLYYQPSANANGTETITFRAWDRSGVQANGANGIDVSSNGGTTPFSAVSDTANITINAVNDAPVNTFPGVTQIIPEDTATAITGISVADVDASPQNVQVTLHVDNGILDVRTDVGGGLNASQVIGDTTGTVVLTGTTAQINATLGNATGLTYRGNLNYVGSDELDIITNDLGHTGSGGALSDTDNVAITVNEVDANTLSAFQSNAFAPGGDTDADGVVDPGENIITTVVITNNSETTAATGVTFAENVTGMLVTAVNVQAIAIADTYNGVTGNTTFSVGDAGAGTGPQGLLLNDVEFGTTFGTGAGQTQAVAVVGQATSQGGTVTINANGSFSYTGAAEFTGADTFTYTLRDAGLDGTFGNGDDLIDIGTATVNVSGLAWFIDNTGASSNIGTQANPFTSIGAFNTANGGVGANTPNAGDTIYLREGTYNEADGINLLNNQKLVGQGESLVINSITIETGSGGQTPIIQVTGATGQGLQLAQNNIISGLNIQTNNAGAIGIEDGGGTVGALNISNVGVTGTGKAVDIDQGGALTVSLTSLSSTGSTTQGVQLAAVGTALTGTFTAVNGTISGSTGTAFQIGNGDAGAAGTGGTVAVSYTGTIGIAGGARGVEIQDRAASAGTVTVAGNITQSAGGTASGIVLDDNVAGNVSFAGATNTFNSTTATAINITDQTGGTVTFSNAVAINTSTGTGVNIGGTTTGSTINFNGGGNGLDIVTTGGASTAFSASGGATISVQGSGNTIDSAGQGLNLVNVVVGAGNNVAFASTDSDGGARGVNIDTVTGGSISLGTGTLSGHTAAEIDINAGNTVVTYGGVIGNGTGLSVEITGHATGNITLSGNINDTADAGGGIVATGNTSGTIAFSGGTQTLNTGASAGVTLTSNTGAIINFTGGGLDIDTTSGAGFAATGGGEVSVTGSGNSIDSDTGTALNVANTNIGVGDMTFRSIDAGTGAGSAGVGISLDTTGTAGGLHVTGTGAAGSGGTIQNKTGGDGSTTGGIGIYLNSTSEVQLDRMSLHDFGNFAIRGINVTGFTLANSTINGVNGSNDGSPFNEGSISFSNLLGTASISSSNISGGFADNIRVINTSGTLTGLTVSNTTIGANSTTNGNDGMTVEAQGAANVAIIVQSSFFTSARGDLFQMAGNGTGTSTLTFTGNALSNNHPGISTGGGGVTLGNGGDRNSTFTVTGNTFRDSKGHAVLVVNGTDGGADTAAIATQDGDLTLVFNNNTIGVAGTANSGSLEGAGIKVQHAGGSSTSILDADIINNNIHQYNNEGILIQAGAGIATGGRIVAEVADNVLSNPGNNPSIGSIFQGFALNSGVTPGDTFVTYLTLGGDGSQENIFTGSGRNGGVDMRIRARQNTDVHITANDSGGSVPAAPNATYHYTGGLTDAVAVATFIAQHNSGTQSHAAFDTGEFRGDSPPAPASLMAAPGGVEEVVVAVEWQVAGFGDFNGDGSADVLSISRDGVLRSDTVTNWYILGQLETGWHLEAIGDINGDGTSDILLGHDDGSYLGALVQNNAIAATVDLALTDGVLHVIAPTAPDAPPSDAPPSDGDGDTAETPAGDPAAHPVIVDDGVLSQSELDYFVDAAIARWEAAGLTAEQVAALHDMTFSVADMPGWYLGSYFPDAVQLDSDAAGYGWFLDATPLEDSEFGNVDGTRLTTDPTGAPAGHVDLLTTIMHEMGHQLGLEDTYSLGDRSDLMYGYLVTGERRLPGEGDAEGATLGSVTSEEFQIATINLGTLAPDDEITIQWAATITPSSAPSNNFNEQIEHPSNQGQVTATNGAGFPDVNTNTSVVTLDSLTLGSLIFDDVNGNGIFESGSETGIDGVDLTLFADTNNTGGLDAGDTQIATAETGSGGLYSFTGLAPGNYIVRVDQTNFGVGGALEFFPNSSAGSPDPDDNIDNDDNGAPIAGGGGVASAAITLAYNSEPDGTPGGPGDVDGDADDDTNLTLDFGFFDIPPNLAPVVTTTGTAAQVFTEGGAAANLEPTLTVDDDDDEEGSPGPDPDPSNDSIVSAVVTITDFFAGDELLFTLSGGVSGGYANGVLTLSGEASEFVYETILRSVQYRSTSDNPEEYGTNTSRNIEFVVNDGSQDSLAATTVVQVFAVNDAPVLITTAPPVLTAVNEDQTGDDPTPSGTVGTLVSALVNLDQPVGGGLDNVTDPDNEFIGIALTGTNTANGTWWYSTAAVPSWTLVGLVSDSNALLLEADANTRLYFQPTTADFNGTIANAITFRAWDLSNDPFFTLNGTFANASATGNATPYSAAADTASITVTAEVDAVTDTPTVAEDSGANTVDVLFNDNFNDPARTLTSFTQGANGAVTLDDNVLIGDASDDRLIYTPNLDFHGSDSFTYTVTSGGVTEIGTVNVTVTPVADIVNDALTTNEETAVTANVITNGAGADNFEASPVIQSVTQGTNGSVTFAANGDVTYTPNADFTGSDSFTYTVLSGGATETATVNVTVNAVADIVTDSVSVAEDSASNTLDLLANDTFENAGRAITAVGGTQAHGVAAINNAGTPGDATDDFVTYTPNDLDFNGTDSFTYTVTSNGTTETAAVNVTITAVADIVNDSATVVEDSGANTIDVLANDQFEDATRELTSFTQGANGVVTRDTNGTASLADDELIYTPNANFDGTDSFTYTVTPPNGTAETATVNITMTPLNDAPVLNAGASPLLSNGTEDSGAPVGVVGTLVASLVDLVGSGGVDNVSEFDAGAITGIALTGTNTADGTWFYSINNGTNWTAVGAVSDASALLLAADVATRLYFRPNADFNGTVSNAITFRAWDQTSGTNGASGVNTSPNGGTTAFSTASDTANLTVNEVNDVPVAVDDPLAAINEDSGVRTITFAELTGNDLDGPANELAQTLTVSAVSNAVGGTVAIVSGHVEFTPTLNFNGAASFDYTVLDNGTTNGFADAKTDVGSVSFTVNPVNDAPVLSDVAPLAIRPPTGGAVTLDSALTISDVDNTTLTSATVRISAGSFFGDGDILAVSAGGLAGTSITATFNPLTETLTLSGADTLAHYEQVLEHVTFELTGPNPTNSGLNKTRTIEWQLNDGSGANNLSVVQTTTIDLARPLTSDFNADGKGDILWQNIDGTPAVWLLDGVNVLTAGPTLPNPNAGAPPSGNQSGQAGPWREIGSSDFNGDGKADILWQNVADGRPAVWLMDGVNVLATGPALSNPGGPTWHAKEAADFNGDGRADILWQNDNGAPSIWLMDGVNVLATGPVLSNPGPSWHTKAAADFNGDGKADILWQNDSGAPAVWLMDGVNVLATGPVLPNPGPSWHALAAADFNGDGNADILWQNADGTPAVWLMDGVNVLATGPLLSNPGASWHAKEAIDANGDGKADILWQNDNGTPAVWLMDGVNVQQTGPTLFNPGASWHIV